MFDIWNDGKCKSLFIIIFNVFAENDDKYFIKDVFAENNDKYFISDIFAENGDKYFISDESDPNGWLILFGHFSSTLLNMIFEIFWKISIHHYFQCIRWK